MSSSSRPPTSGRSFAGLIVLLLAIGIFWVVQLRSESGGATRKVSYDEMLALVRGGQVKEVDLTPAEVRAVLKPAGEGATAPRAVTNRLPNVDEKLLVDALDAHKVKVDGRGAQGGAWTGMLVTTLLPFVLIAAFYFWGIRGATRGSGPLSFGRSRAKIYDASHVSPVTFADVAGVDEAVGELAEVVQFLRKPEEYKKLGARIPRGVLLVGPPGTGKTLLARAVAGESKVPFFSITGSEFVEMFVGVGAARVRDLFEQAKERAPCLVFIDEIDAIGKSRGGAMAMGMHDEREQTLNQLLAEMDGFDANSGVILMAATNRPEVLDAALMRAGRFDRQVLVDRPDLRGREAILKVHAARIRLSKDVDLALVAQRTSGMVGADLANVVNEAALSGARRRVDAVELCDFEEAIDRLLLGLKKHGPVMNAEEKRRVAHHEAGHALVALSLPHGDPVHRVTIIPRSIGALGATLQLPTEDRYLMTRAELSDRICVMLGGRVAEEMVLGDVSTGARDDLERATRVAKQMVCRFGMSEALGARTYGISSENMFLPGEAYEQRDYSEQTSRAIDEAVLAIIETASARARDIVAERRLDLESMAKLLLEKETLDRADLETLLHRTQAA